MRNVKIYVEGYHDRSFLKGWLLRRGWGDARLRNRGRNPVTNSPVTEGRFGFYSRKDSTFVEIAPAHGDSDLLSLVGSVVKVADPPDPDEIVIVLDVDGSELADGIARRQQSVHDRLARSGVEPTREGSSWRLSSGVLVHLALWSCDGPDCDGVPAQHTLERIVSTAIARSYPDRAAAVQAWLDRIRESGRPLSPKNHSWSYMAGWYAHLGCDAFLSNLWDDPNVPAALEAVLSESGVEAIIRRFE